MTRRGVSEGTIRQRGNGTWEARYRAGDGRQHSVYGKTRREAQERLRAAQRNADHGIQPISERMTTGEYLDLWLAASVRPRLRASTAENYATIVACISSPRSAGCRWRS